MDRLMAFDQQTLIQWAIQLINTIVLVFALSKILYNPVKKYLHGREEKISGNLAEADQLLLNANTLKEWYDDKIASVEDDAQELIEAARVRAANLESQVLKEARIEAEAIKARALKEIEQEKENSLDEMKKQIIDISALIAERYVAEKMDKKTSNRLLEEAIDDLGDATWLN